MIINQSRLSPGPGDYLIPTKDRLSINKKTTISHA